VNTPHPSEDGEALTKTLPLLASEAASELALSSSRKQWFAVYTTCRHEKRVSEHLELRTIEHYLPLYRSRRKWKDGSKVILSLPLFPGYVFVRIGRAERVPVLEVPGVLWFVGNSSAHPTPLPEFEIDTLRAALDPSRVEPFPLLTAGQRVRIRSGSLAGIEGIVVRQKNSFRVVITLELIRQSIAVEVDADDLEPIESSTRAFAGLQGTAQNQTRGLAFCES
jgi:transcription antitermination factor NusG